MKQYLLAIIAVLAAIIFALFSIDTTNNQHSQSYSTYQRVNWPVDDDAPVSVVKNELPSPVEAMCTPSLQQDVAVSLHPDVANPDPNPPAMLAFSAMTELTPVQLPPLDAGMVNVTGGIDGNDQTAGYRVNPRPGEFAISMPYNPSLLPQGFAEDDIQTYVYDRQYHRWIAIQRDSVNEAELLVYSRFARNPLAHTQSITPAVETVHAPSLQDEISDLMSFTSQGEGGGDSPLDFINAVLKTPEMPETSAYTPTSIKELKAADPLEGLTLIQPPTANNSGTANLSYPIEIPAGRQGMQPNLALTYSSGGGNGWLGVGWDIPIPSITVETRWGVPRYDQNKESEVYVYEGEQLVTRKPNGDFREMPHRTNQWTDRHDLDQDGHEQFYPRKNEAFDSIVRHGNGPSNYWWSVTHRNGVTDYYGKKHGSATVDYNSVLCDQTNHNIAQWMLTESVDPNGNWVRYYYHKELRQTVNTLGGFNKGVQVCLDSIQYTGHTFSDPKYSVRFNLNGNDRKDVITNGRYGFREVTAVTLCNVEVLYKDTVLRRYYFVTENTRESNFKTRLTDLVRMDSPDVYISCDSVFKTEYWTGNDPAPGFLESNDSKLHMIRYNFDYFDYPDQNSLYSPAKTIDNLESDGIGSAFSTYHIPATALGSTRGNGASFGGTVSVGAPDKNIAVTDFNVGGNFSYSCSSTEGTLTLIDLNGDGLADKVYKRNYEIYYRPQMIDETDSLLFHFGDEVRIPGINDFLFEESHQPSLGVQGSILSVLAANAGIPSSFSTTSTYFSDINGDGLPDLVTDRGALFNSLDSDGNPTFTPVNSYRTDPDDGSVNTNMMIVTSATAPCGGIIYDGKADSSIFCDYHYIKDSVFFKGDVDTCPYIVALLADPTIVPIGYDGFHFYYYHIDTTYVDCGPITKEPDLNAVRVWVAPFNGHVTINSNISMIPEHSEGYLQSRFTDGVSYAIEYNSGCSVDSDMVLHAQDTSVLISGSLGCDDTLSVNESYNMEVNKYDILFFRIQSKDDRTYDNVEWKVDIHYNDIHGVDGYGKNKANYYSDSDYVLTGQYLFQAPKKGEVVLTGILRGNPGGNEGKLYISSDNPIDTITITANTNNDIVIYEHFELDSGQVVMLEIKGIGGNIFWGNIDCKPHLQYVVNPYDTMFGIPEELNIYPPVRLDIHHPDTSDTITSMRKFFGPLYRGWGQFAYKNDSLSVSQPIDVTTLRLPAYLNNPSLTADSATFAASITSALSCIDTSNHVPDFTMETLSSMIGTIFNPLSDNTRWVEMTPDMEHYRWAGFSSTTSVSRSGMSNTRPVLEIAVLDGDNYPSDMTTTHELIEYDHPVPVSLEGFPVQTIRKMNVSVMGNGSLSVIGSEGNDHPSLSFGQSVSGGVNYVVSDYLDLNGDQYPDLLCKKQVQYTMPWGGIGPKQVLNPVDDELCNSNTYSEGASFSGSYPTPKRQAGGNAQKAKITIDGLGGSLMSGTDETSVMYMDINGDGLPDRIHSDGKVALNKGYSFDPKEDWGCGTPRTGSSENNSTNIGSNFNLEQTSIGGGLGKNLAENVTETQLMDLNGDGLPDKVRRVNNSLRVNYNLGGGNWSSLEDVLAGIDDISKNHSYSETGNGALTLGFEPVFLKIQIGIQLTPYNSSFSCDKAQLTDINGDGYPDYVTSDDESSMIVRYNTAGKTNLLKKVTNFTGSTVTLDYDMPLSCYEKPQRGWNLASVEVNDPASPLPAARSLTRFSYADPHYNRYERMDFGYGRVTTSQYDTDGDDSLYRYTVEEFENHSFTKRGRKLRDCVYASNHRPFVEHLYFATVYDHDNSATVDTGCARSDLYVGHEAELTLYYEGDTIPRIVSRVGKDYDRYRNVIRYTHYGDTTHTNEYFTAEIEYAHNMPHNMVSLPTKIVVKDYNGNTLQKRTAIYDSIGRLQQHANHSSLIDSSVFNFSYNSFGNLSSLALPKNQNGQRLNYKYDYDTEVYTFPVQVTNSSLGFTSTAVYDYKFGKPIRTTDINGNEMHYTYDFMGRVLKILAPYEADSGRSYTIRMTYAPKNYNKLDIFTPCSMQNYACTFHYDPSHPDNDLRTVVLSDGIGRLLQTKKDVEIAGNEKCIVTGKTVFDCFGRTVAQHQPFTENLGTENIYNDSVTAIAALNLYDILDRQTFMRQPYGYVTTMSYGFDTCGGHQCLCTAVTDPMGNTVKALTGTLGQQLKQIAPGNTVTRFKYDCLGRLLQSTDPDNISTYYSYDMLGRLTERIHPDAGTDRYHYDAAGNMTAHVNALSDSVIYRYHYNQLTDVEFPRYPANNVHYQYGTNAHAINNAVGKIIFQEDASGWQTFRYGKLGELTDNFRTFALPFSYRTYSFRMQYRYDSYNRIQSMTYPDGEVVSYDYNRGGMLMSVSGNKNGVSSLYISEISYNQYELKDFETYGNGIQIRYAYDSLQRLERLVSTSIFDTMQNITYSYDSAGNITHIQNSAGVQSSGFGGAYQCDFTYDNNYRMTTAHGEWYGSPQCQYNMSMSYHNNGRISEKSLEIADMAGFMQSQYTNEYYYSSNCNKLTTIGPTYRQDFDWDATGNMVFHRKDCSFYQDFCVRNLCWDEQNRLLGVRDDQYLSFYLYDANGDRTYKLAGLSKTLNINGQSFLYYTMDNATLYVSPYLVATPQGYTKHYYAENERIASRIGGGGLLDVDNPSTPGENIITKVDIVSDMFNNLAPYCLGVDLYDTKEALNHLYHWQDSVQPENDCYWYNPDHLGSSSWITDTGGYAVQHLYYLPWGEDFVNQKSSSFDGVRFTFSAKERDPETGLSYFGSRYYSSDLSIWLSVDPMSDKYASLSPYVYCADNPVRCVDPNGEEIVGTDGKAVTYSYDNEGNVVWSDNATDDTKRIGNAMLQTETGKEQLDFLIGSNSKITMEIDKKDCGDVMGRMIPGKAVQNKDGSIELKSAKIVIYEGSINHYFDENSIGRTNISNDKTTMGKLTNAAKPTIDQYIGAVACHEAEHVRPDNLLLNFTNSEDLEKQPNQKKANYLIEIIKSKRKQ